MGSSPEVKKFMIGKVEVILVKEGQGKRKQNREGFVWFYHGGKFRNCSFEAALANPNKLIDCLLELGYPIKSGFKERLIEAIKEFE
jgi:hypothetical protein